MLRAALPALTDSADVREARSDLAQCDLILGDHRYYAGHAKETRCINRQAAVEAALNAVFGDLQAFCDLLLRPAAEAGRLQRRPAA